jgi:threonine aldolase
MGQRLYQDHQRAQRLSQGLRQLAGGLEANIPQTNIVVVNVSGSGRDAPYWVQALAALGILVRARGDKRLRCVTHRHIRDEDIDRSVEGFRRVLEHTYP